jgi:SET domain-containing protein
MKKETNEFSFVLKPARYGVGVFAVHNIVKGSHLRLFVDEKTLDYKWRELSKKKVPKIFWGHCLDRGKTLICPSDFGAMPIGWYLNHSSTPNAGPGKNPNPHRRYRWYSLRNIKAGEEIMVDYNNLEEPGKYFYNKSKTIK